MSDTPLSLSERLKSEGEKTLAFFRSLHPEQWEQQIYTEGSCWSTHQILAHFVATESSFNRLVTNILMGGSGAPGDFNIDAYNERKVGELAGVSRQDMFEMYAKYRQQNVTLVSQMQDADLQKKGRHPFLGIVELSGIIKLIYRHNQIHLREIRRELSLE